VRQCPQIVPQIVLLAEMPVEMSEVDRRRIGGIAFLLASADGASYRQRLREVSESLGISARSMRRLVQRWREAGLSGVVRPVRSDRGASRLCSEWQSFIIETWRWVNREGGCERGNFQCSSSMFLLC
jgi:Homeodomain-like domain